VASSDGHPAIVNGGMVTLNGIPTLFGGGAWRADHPLEPTQHVLQFVDVENGDEVNKWKNIGDLKYKRQRHVVVPVPLEFICAQEEVTTTTTTERYSSLSSNLALLIYGLNYI
jgi:hypothetical protein